MNKTTPHDCQKCKHSTVIKSLHYVACDYYLNTGKRRGCPVGWCDKFEPKKRGGINDAGAD